MSAPIRIDLDAIVHNYRAFADAVPAPVIPVVKAEAYGHGGVAVAQALASMPADQRPWMLAVADAAEAYALRAAGIDLPLICWLQSSTLDWQKLRAVPDLHVGISSLHELAMLADAAPVQAGRVDRSAATQVHLKLDTGLGRNGARECEWRVLMAQALLLERQGRIRVAGIMSHVSGTSKADDAAQLDAFRRGVALAIEIGLRPDLIHLAATVAAMQYANFVDVDPAWARDDTDASAAAAGRHAADQPGYRPTFAVRLGLALYGLDPLYPDSLGLDLQPVMELRTDVVGRDDRWVMELGQADGLPPRVNRLLLNDNDGDRWQVGQIGSTHSTLLPLDGTSPSEMRCFGSHPGDVNAWAYAADTINYEITTRMMSRLRDNAPARIQPPEPGLAPQRVFTIDLDLIAARLAGGTGALHRGEQARSVEDRHLSCVIDLSANAYGFGAERIAELGRAFGKSFVARTQHDVEALAVVGIDAEYLPTAGPETRLAYGFGSGAAGAGSGTGKSGELAGSLSSELIQVKRVDAGQAVSYGYTWQATRPTTLGLVPLGYADAIPRSVFGRAMCFVNGVRVPIVGRVAMDQVVVDLGDHNCAVGMPVAIWGGRHGASLQEWCAWSGLTPAAVTATLGSRVTRRYLGGRVEGLA